MNAKEKPTTKASKLTSKLCHNLLYTNKTATSIANVTTTEQFVSLRVDRFASAVFAT